MKSKTNKPTDFEIEIKRIEKEVSELEDNALNLPLDSEKATRFIYRLYQRASLNGSLADFSAAETAIKRAIPHLSQTADLYFLKANLDFKFHRLADVRRDLEMGPGLQDSLQGRAIKADLDFQEGLYEEARKGYEDVIREDRTWDNLARLAYFKFKMGDIESADRLYVEAEDEITAKQMRSYAWVELQRGVLKLAQGLYEEALAHYRRAERAYSGYWLVDEHIAELSGAEGKFDEALTLYRQIIARLPKPELQQALGELYVLTGEPQQAQPWFEKALAAYLESAERGEVHYYHHLADFYTDARPDGALAVKWARKDVGLRDNFSTQAALAWALYHDGKFDEALARIKQALSSGAKDARLFYQSAIIHRSAGRENGEHDYYLHLAAEINPHYRNFHMHH